MFRINKEALPIKLAALGCGKYDKNLWGYRIREELWDGAGSEHKSYEEQTC
jgi:hypothetical protein